MASSRPGTLAHFQVGKHISAIANFVSTMNWIVSWVSNFKVGSGLKLSGESSGKPVLKVDSGSVRIVPGTNTNMVFTQTKSGDETTITVDLYYK